MGVVHVRMQILWHQVALQRSGSVRPPDFLRTTGAFGRAPDGRASARLDPDAVTPCCARGHSTPGRVPHAISDYEPGRRDGGTGHSYPHILSARFGRDACGVCPGSLV